MHKVGRVGKEDERITKDDDEREGNLIAMQYTINQNFGVHTASR